MNDFVTALGLLLAIEGTFYAAFPGPAKRMMQLALQSDDGSLRRAGLAALAGGIVLVWLVRG
jgi:uncharacterized protein YjeT (DUF2065 family)